MRRKFRVRINKHQKESDQNEENKFRANTKQAAEQKYTENDMQHKWNIVITSGAWKKLLQH